MHLGNKVTFSSIFMLLYHIAGQYAGVDIHMIMCLCGLHIRTQTTTGYSVGLWLSTHPLYVLTSSKDPVIP